MNKPLRNTLAIAMLLAIGTLASAHRAAAADPKPALTIAFAGYDQLISDLKVLDELSPHAKLAEKAKAGIESQTHGKGLAGLDKGRPWGVLVSLGENDQPVVHGFLPATDLKKLLASLPVAGGEASPNANGNFELPMGEKTIYAKQNGKWAVFSDNEETLKGALPIRPSPTWRRSISSPSAVPCRMFPRPVARTPSRVSAASWNSRLPCNRAGPRSSGR